MKKEKEFNLMYDGIKMYVSYNDLHIPKEYMDEIFESSNRLLINERNDKIDKLLNEDK